MEPGKARRRDRPKRHLARIFEVAAVMELDRSGEQRLELISRTAG